MKAKASVASDFLKVSRDLEEAIARHNLTARELRLLAWVRARTYGVRYKDGDKWRALDAVPVSANFISEDTGIRATRIKQWTFYRRDEERIAAVKAMLGEGW